MTAVHLIAAFALGVVLLLGVSWFIGAWQAGRDAIAQLKAQRKGE